MGRGKIFSSSHSDDEMSLYSDSDLNGTILSEAAEMMDQDMILEEVSTDKVHPGAFILVEIVGGTRKKTKYTYAAIVQNEIDEEGEVKVMCLKANDCNKNYFVLMKMMYRM